ncbi:MAG TPA: DUF434 domain-containing protein [Pyrinomonadaceae bacterium]|nr:DUF434 domain-containing protein [Pyrinomonadaceae bacterium]
MPDFRKHRGAHPEDHRLFANDQLPALGIAVAELSWLLTRDYTVKAAVKLVGDRHALTERQRLAVSRAACSDQSREHRTQTHLAVADLSGAEVVIDGFNLIITSEAALSGGVLLVGRDGCLRDLSSVHGSYRAVAETKRAVQLIGELLAASAPKSVKWLLDKPVSNSGRLAQLIRDSAAENGWPWTVETCFNPDREIVSSAQVVISSDGPLLEQVGCWTNFTRQLVEKMVEAPWLIDLS